MCAMCWIISSLFELSFISPPTLVYMVCLKPFSLQIEMLNEYSECWCWWQIMCKSIRIQDVTQAFLVDLLSIYIFWQLYSNIYHCIVDRWYKEALFCKEIYSFIIRATAWTTGFDTFDSYDQYAGLEQIFYWCSLYHYFTL